MELPTDALVALGFSGAGELPEDKKLPHDAVGYEHPSGHSGERCGNCRHLVVAEPLRCEHVQCPIRSGDWCKKWERLV